MDGNYSFQVAFLLGTKASCLQLLIRRTRTVFEERGFIDESINAPGQAINLLLARFNVLHVRFRTPHVPDFVKLV